jgi:integrase
MYTSQRIAVNVVMGLLQEWRRTTSYAADDDLIFPSVRLRGKKPRVPNMLVEDHLRPAARKVLGDVINGHRFGFHNLRQGLASFFVEAGIDLKTIQNSLRWADPSILLKTYAHSRPQKRMEAQGLMLDAMGLTEETAQRLIQ